MKSKIKKTPKVSENGGMRRAQTTIGSGDKKDIEERPNERERAEKS